MASKYVKSSDVFSTSGNGVVPKPTAADVTENKVLQADGNWVAQSGGGGSYSHDYSTNEKVVGKWIDGSPVYEKTYDCGNNPVELVSNAWSNTPIPNNNIGLIIDIKCIHANGTHFSFIAANTDNVSPGVVQVINVRSVNAWCRYFIIRYTKKS